MTEKLDKISFDKQLEEYFSNKKQRKYYTYNDVINLTGISERTFRYRISELKNRYKNVPSLLAKKNKKWQIHYTLVDDFMPLYKPRTITLSNFDWKSIITWCMVDNYGRDYHQQLINEVLLKFPEHSFYYCIEKTKKGVNHVHMVTNANKIEIKDEVDKILNRYLSKNVYRLQVEDIMKKSQAINYLNK